MRSRRTRCCGGRRRLGLGMPARVRMRRPHRPLEEAKAVRLHIDRAQFPEDRLHSLHSRLTEAEQVHVSRCAMHGVVPELQQGRALEHELVAVARLRQAEQQALVRIAREQLVEVRAALAGAVEQTLADRGGKVPWTLGTHASASM